MKGPSWVKYLEGAKWPLELKNSETFYKLLRARNAFTCQAHLELLTNFLRLIEDDKLNEAGKYIPHIKTLQHGLWERDFKI